MIAFTPEVKNCVRRYHGRDDLAHAEERGDELLRTYERRGNEIRSLRLSTRMLVNHITALALAMSKLVRATGHPLPA